MKKLLTVLFTLALAVSLGAPVFAAPSAQDSGTSSASTSKKKAHHHHSKKKKKSSGSMSGSGR